MWGCLVFVRITGLFSHPDRGCFAERLSLKFLFRQWVGTRLDVSKQEGLAILMPSACRRLKKVQIKYNRFVPALITQTGLNSEELEIICRLKARSIGKRNNQNTLQYCNFYPISKIDSNHKEF
jgi:hypothetical protein